MTGRPISDAMPRPGRRRGAALRCAALLLPGAALLLWAAAGGGGAEGEERRAGQRRLLSSSSSGDLAGLRKATLHLGRRVEQLTESLASVVHELAEQGKAQDNAARSRAASVGREGEAAARELKKAIEQQVKKLESEHVEHYKDLQKMVKDLPKSCGLSPQDASPQRARPISQYGGGGADYAAAYYQQEAQQGNAMGPPPPDPCADETGDGVSKCRQKEIRNAFLHSWNAYKKYAWGQDELMPLSRRPKNWGKGSVGMGLTMLDAISTLWIMGLKDEFDEVRAWVRDEMDVNVDISVSTFETTIRMIGGMLSAYELSGEKHKEFLDKAKDVADRVLYAYNTSSGVPHANVNLKTHFHTNPHWTGGSSVLSEFGTVQLELRTLSYHLGNSLYDEKGTWIMDIVEAKAPPDFLCPTYYNTIFNRWTTDHVTLGALGDSFYEYLLKQYLLTGKTEQRYKRMYEAAVKGILTKLVKKSVPSGQTYVAEYKRGALFNKMDHLACFTGGMFALGVHEIGHAVSSSGPDNDEVLRVAEELTETCYQMYHKQPSGVAPELVEFRGGSDMATSPRAEYYLLRPEAVESFMYLWRVTKKQKYREWGWEVFRSINRWCRVDSGGYSGLRNVGFVPPQKDDLQQSFWLAETLKYLYILFGDDDVFDFGEWVLNTEAHPLKIRKRNPLDLWPEDVRRDRERDVAMHIDQRLQRHREEFEARQARQGPDSDAGAGFDPYGASGGYDPQVERNRAERAAREREERRRQQRAADQALERGRRASERGNRRRGESPDDGADGEQARLERLERSLRERQERGGDDDAAP
eukprot:TRINITY_DN9927_c0_g1_i1.p1 TRINITY_DN9927_c0_g1~~TRINITY_DN9927_c0_g1_i1.p1  ORF type:complete len:811 (+),score=282.85 TRINITY_DN9927_c0_g1_i1:41-2473(+)